LIQAFSKVVAEINSLVHVGHRRRVSISRCLPAAIT